MNTPTVIFGNGSSARNTVIMTSCFENIRLPSCESFDLSEKRNTVSSIIAGSLFFTGWWIMIDASAYYPEHKVFDPAYHVCGVLGTISFFMVNIVTNGQVRGETYTDGCLGPTGARIWLFIGLVLGFGSVIAGCWILFAAYVVPHVPDVYPGVSVFLQNVFILAGSLVFKFGRSEELWS